jgi:putative hydrolase of HD superfamily
MQTKAENPITTIQADSLPVFVQAYFEFNHLKQLYRQGWLRRGVPPERCESVAEHSFGVAVLALWLAESYAPELDIGKVIRMALLHDFGEIYAGDIIPSDPVTTEQKAQIEVESITQVLGKLPLGESYVKLWQEFEAGASPEAQFVRQIDRLEMGLQAAVYRSQGMDNMQEFLLSARQALTDQALIDLLTQIETLTDDG